MLDRRGLDAIARGQSVVGLENHTSFIRAVRNGRVRVTATPLTRGRRSQVWEATARDDEGRIISTGRVRLICFDPGSEVAGKKVERRDSARVRIGGCRNVHSIDCLRAIRARVSSRVPPTSPQPLPPPGGMAAALSGLTAPRPLVLGG